MEETMGLNMSDKAANASALIRLPDLVVMFTPVLLIQLLVGLVSNLLLIALLVKASSVNGQNNTNIYLYSMAVNNLISLFPALTLLISTITKEWALGQGVCSLNQFVSHMVAAPHYSLHAFISRERYKAVLRFAEWKPYSRRTYIIVTFIWSSALSAGVIGVVQGGQVAGKTDDVLSCYLPNRWFDERRLLPLIIVYLIWACMFNVASLVFSAVHYCYTLKALCVIRGIRVHNRPETKLDHLAISWEAEIRSLKSMASVFFVSIVPFTIGYVYFVVVVTVSVIEGKRFSEVNRPILQVAFAVCAYLIPTASPLLLIAINKRFRMRMKDLFRWQLKPTDVASTEL